MSTATDPGLGAPTLSFTSTPDAFRALAATVAAAQQDGPLQPVTVIAPSHASALDIAHFRGRVTNGGHGSAAVRTVTLPDLAGDLAVAAGQLSGRASLPAMVRGGAITAALGTPQAVKRLGSVIGFQLAPEQDPSAAAFRRALEQHSGINLLTAAAPFSPGETILSASDADDEARAVVRLVIDRLASGVPGHRIGVFYSAAEPYRALLAQRLAEGGLRVGGRPFPRNPPRRAPGIAPNN